MKLTSPEILRHLVRRFGLLVLLTLLGAAAGGVYGALKTPSYTAQAYVVVTGQPGEPNVAVNFAQAYGRIVSTGLAADKAAAALGSSKDLTQVTASTSPDTPVIEITATSTDAARTAAVANAVAQALVAAAGLLVGGLAVLAGVGKPRTSADRPEAGGWTAVGAPPVVPGPVHD